MAGAAVSIAEAADMARVLVTPTRVTHIRGRKRQRIFRRNEASNMSCAYANTGTLASQTEAIARINRDDGHQMNWSKPTEPNAL